MNNPSIEEVLHLVNGTSNNYVPAPSHSLIQAYLLIGIRKCKNYILWKELGKKKEEGSGTDSEGVMEEKY